MLLSNAVLLFLITCAIPPPSPSCRLRLPGGVQLGQPLHHERRWRGQAVCVGLEDDEGGWQWLEGGCDACEVAGGWGPGVLMSSRGPPPSRPPSHLFALLLDHPPHRSCAA